MTNTSVGEFAAHVFPNLDPCFVQILHDHRCSDGLAPQAVQVGHDQMLERRRLANNRAQPDQFGAGCNLAARYAVVDEHVFVGDRDALFCGELSPVI
jgi:hypothetical protein